ncbi:hypothetical protein KC19_4G220400 [Ceratodon purpureus]|uniref:S-protein homolog n=1 Tax=Ceratodon purpureus TaxID=3225 RepID=A0A8T0IDS9_CERPU|nr:hypothetical protein KC19_4G220400 [Ceratodon purpureus]KAG0581046.1 hypothetical protein KC19_4G220400 [Ceratodon purpureus]
MASSTSFRIIMACLLLQIIVSPIDLVKGATLTITVENELVKVGQILNLHCTLNGKDLGRQSMPPFNRFVHTLTPSILGGEVFTCTFAAAGKPTTTIDVFKGFSFAHRPCECLGIDHCFWQVLNEGFWCNSKFIKTWG